MPTGNAHRPRVLIVEDNADLAFGLRMNIEQEGYDTRVVQDGEEALGVARDWSPDVVILDLVLPGRDGLELLQQWRSSGQDMRILILSGKAEEVDVVSGLRLGADDYVTKPFGLLELLARVRKQVDLSRSLRGVAGTDALLSDEDGTATRDPPRAQSGGGGGQRPLEVVFGDDSVLVGGRAARFTRTEMVIFRALAEASPCRAGNWSR
jgi:DNA-binding response OmpR family regulator